MSKGSVMRYHPKSARIATVLLLLILILVGYAMLSTAPSKDFGGSFSGYRQIAPPSPVVGGGGGARDVFRKAL